MGPDARTARDVFVATGLVISLFNRRLQLSQQAQRTAVEMATARAERLDAILNTTIDGIIVINAKGNIEALNRGAQELFGYPESEVIGRNVSLLMPFARPPKPRLAPTDLVRLLPRPQAF